MAPGFLSVARSKLQRDAGRLPWFGLMGRAFRYARELATAKIYLRAADSVGAHARTLGRPWIENFGRLEIGSNVLIRNHIVRCEIGTGPNGVLRIGDGVRMNYGVSAYAEHSVQIGNRVRIGPYAMIVDTDFHDTYQRSTRKAGVPVVIEDDAWIGAKAAILKGVRIGRGAVVGVGAVVTESVKPFTIVAGVPARVVSTLDEARFVVEDVA